MLKKCTKSCLKLGFFHFYCMVLIQLLKKVLVDKGWRESSYNKKQFFRHCGEIPVKYLLSFFLLPPARAAAAVPMNCSGSKWFWRLAVLTSSAPSPVLLFLASFTGTEGWWVMHLVTGLLCFLHPFAKTRWVLISLNLRKLFQYGKETAQHSAAFLAPRTAPSTQELSQNVLLVCPCCSFVTTMCLSIWYWKTASVTCLSFGQSVRVVAAQDHGSSDNPAGCIPGAVCLVLLESIMESCLLKRQENYKGNVSASPSLNPNTSKFLVFCVPCKQGQYFSSSECVLKCLSEGQREVWKKIPEKDTTHYKFENRQQEKLRFKSGLSNLRYLKYSSQEEGTRKKMVLLVSSHLFSTAKSHLSCMVATNESFSKNFCNISCMIWSVRNSSDQLLVALVQL